MSKSLGNLEKYLISVKNERNGTVSREASREEIELAMEEYLARGGTITRVEPEWIEEGLIYILN